MVWIALLLIGIVALNALAKWVRTKLAVTARVAKEQAKAELRAETEARLNLVKADLVATGKAIREENHEIARRILEELRLEIAQSTNRRPPGPAGFAGVRRTCLSFV